MRKLKNSELERLDIQSFKEAEKTPVTVILDNVRSLHNIGSVFRTSDAFRIEKIFLCGITAAPPHSGIHKTALGATDSVAWEYSADTIAVVKTLQQEQIEVIAIEQTVGSIALQDFELDPKKKYAVVFGNEVKGVQQEVLNECDACIEIPQYGTKHSLNIAVSAGVVLWELFSQFKY
jgi:tRNA G18 (ribose-2'-O)-methylase SpoU